MSMSLNTPIQGIPYQTHLNLQPKISKENETLKNQIIEIGKTDPNRASMLSRKIVTWDGSQKALDQLSAEGLNVSHFITHKLLGGTRGEVARALRENPQLASNIISNVESLSRELENVFNSFNERRCGEFIQRTINTARSKANDHGRFNALIVNSRIRYSHDFQGILVNHRVRFGVKEYDLFVFERGRFENHGDSGYQNWCFKGNFTRNDKVVHFS